MKHIRRMAVALTCAVLASPILAAGPAVPSHPNGLGDIVVFVSALVSAIEAWVSSVIASLPV